MKHYFVTGGAGFIGSHVVDRLLEKGNRVTVYDNFSTGQEDFLENASTKPGFELIRGDLLAPDSLTRAMRGCDFVFHMAANADVHYGIEHPGRDLEQNTIATFNVLEAMRSNGIKQIAFPSTGSIYGECEVIPTPESAPFPIQTSFYGASKLAGEGLIEAYCEGFGFQSWIFRFVSILGERYTHGHVFDFYKKLLKNPRELEVLGDGHQRKSYLYVHECIDAMFLAVERARDKINIFNLGADETIEVNDSIRWITERLGVSPSLHYAGGSKGWIGDNPVIFLDCAKIRKLGWAPKLSIREGIIRTLDYLQHHQSLLKRL